MRDSHRRKTPVYSWLRKLSSQGVKPILTTLAVCADYWQEREREIIAKMRKSGAKLLNLADGGDEPLCTPEHRRKAGLASLNKRRADAQMAVESILKSYIAATNPQAKERLKRDIILCMTILPKEYKESFVWP